MISSGRAALLLAALWMSWQPCIAHHDHGPPTVSPAPTESPAPSPSPSAFPTDTQKPTLTMGPSYSPSEHPSMSPTTHQPSAAPTESPAPSPSPSEIPSASPSEKPSISQQPTLSLAPSNAPSMSPSISPSQSPSVSPSQRPSASPSVSPTVSAMPSDSPSSIPSVSPSMMPSSSPSSSPSESPSSSPTLSMVPSDMPSMTPTRSQSPSFTPTTSQVPSTPPTTSHEPTNTLEPTESPSSNPSAGPWAIAVDGVTAVVSGLEGMLQGDEIELFEGEAVSFLQTRMETPSTVESVTIESVTVTGQSAFSDTSVGGDRRRLEEVYSFTMTVEAIVFPGDADFDLREACSSTFLKNREEFQDILLIVGAEGTPQNPSSPATSKGGNSGGSKAAPIAAGTIAGVLVFVIGSASLVFYRRRQAQFDALQKVHTNSSNGDEDQPSLVLARSSDDSTTLNGIYIAPETSKEEEMESGALPPLEGDSWSEDNDSREGETITIDFEPSPRTVGHEASPRDIAHASPAEVDSRMGVESLSSVDLGLSANPRQKLARGSSEFGPKWTSGSGMINTGSNIDVPLTPNQSEMNASDVEDPETPPDVRVSRLLRPQLSKLVKTWKDTVSREIMGTWKNKKNSKDKKDERYTKPRQENGVPNVVIRNPNPAAGFAGMSADFAMSPLSTDGVIQSYTISRRAQSLPASPNFNSHGSPRDDKSMTYPVPYAIPSIQHVELERRLRNEDDHNGRAADYISDTSESSCGGDPNH